jgi:hypothetical protein
MDTEQIDVLAQKLLDVFEAKMSRVVPFEYLLWSTADIGAYLRRPVQVVRERVVVVPGFPEAIRLPNFGGGKAHPRWKASEVVAWAESYKGGSRIGRPRKKDTA